MSSSEIDGWAIALEFIAGLVLFLYAVTLLSDALKQLGGERIKKGLARFTRNRFTGVLTGTAATIAIDSSSVTIIMVIALVNAGLLGFAESLAVVMGSNIGTAFSSQLYAFSIDDYAPIALLVGFLGSVLAKSDRWRDVSTFVFSLGLIFFSLHLMGESMAPLQDHPPFTRFIENLTNPWLGALIGAVGTALIQSSSAMMGIVIVMAGQGIMPLPVGVSIMLGAEIGTCADTLLATIGRSRGAIRTGVFHLLFNLSTVVLGVLFVEQLVGLVEALAPNASVERQIAHAHVLFNVLGVALFISFTHVIARLLQAAIPDKQAQPEPA